MTRTKAKSLKENRRYKDAPRYKVIYGYEDDFKNGFKKILIDMQKDLLKAMHKMKP